MNVSPEGWAIAIVLTNVSPLPTNVVPEGLTVALGADFLDGGRLGAVGEGAIALVPSALVSIPMRILESLLRPLRYKKNSIELLQSSLA